AQLRAATNADDDTGTITQPYRVAGTVNYPNRKKVARGRVVCDTRTLGFNPDCLWTVEEFDQEFSPAPPKQVGERAAFESPDEGSIPADTLKVVREGVEEGKRSHAFWNVIVVLKANGWSIDSIVMLLERYPAGIGAKYVGRLQHEVARVWSKVDAGQD